MGEVPVLSAGAAEEVVDGGSRGHWRPVRCGDALRALLHVSGDRSHRWVPRVGVQLVKGFVEPVSYTHL